MEVDQINMDIHVRVEVEKTIMGKGEEKKKINHYRYRKRLGQDRHGQESGVGQEDR